MMHLHIMLYAYWTPLGMFTFIKDSLGTPQKYSQDY